MTPGRADSYVRNLEHYFTMYDWSLEDPEAFWAEQAGRLDWSRQWEEVSRWDFDEPKVEWFLGGQLNASVNCLDRHVAAGYGDTRAIIWEGNDGDTKIYTYGQLLAEVERAAGAFKALGVGRGDRVCIYLQMIPELAIAMLACARIGAIHSVVFGAFSADSLRLRLNDAGCKLLVTQDTGVRGAKNDIPMKGNADQALQGAPSVEHVLVVNRTNHYVPMQGGRDRWWHEELAAAPAHCTPEPMDAEDPLFILYTSGSTGKPKGVVHTTGGYLVYAAATHHFVFDYRPGDVYWCTADIGWITGHSYIVYGPLANRATVVMFEGVPNYPNHGRFWEVVDKHKVNILYTAPTALRALMKEGDTWPGQHDLSSLRLLGTVGEPIKPPEWNWYHKVIGGGRCPIVDTWWQTETGGILISPLPGATPLKAGSATLPFFGIEPAIVDDHGQEFTGSNVAGNLVMKRPWPGMARTIWGDHPRFRETYFARFPGRYFTGDGCRRDEDSYYWITGRVDDIIIVSGHNLGTAEIEGAIGHHPAVAEAAVVGFPHDVKGQAPYAFVCLRTGQEVREGLVQEAMHEVRARIGPHAVPERVQFVSGLPKTRSGKIMRRILRKIAEGDVSPESLGDISTLADPSVVDALVAGRQ